MSANNEERGRLTFRDKELVALGAAIASNCVPCVEYHVPQGRKAGLSDSEIGEAVALADKVRQVPAAKVLQTASALLKAPNRTPIESKGQACGCPDSARAAAATATGPADPQDVRLDGECAEGDSETRRGENTMDSTHPGGSDQAAARAQNAMDYAGFDLPRMMEMMHKCCPDKMMSFSSMMSDFEKRCYAPNEKASSTEPA